MDALTAKSNEIRRLHAVCRTQRDMIKELVIACQQTIITINNRVEPDESLTQEWTRILANAEEML